MLPSLTRWRTPAALFIGLCATVLTAHAQPAARATRPDPLDPAASVPPPAYESAFARHRRPGDDKPIAWREANDAVARIGGWRAYAREAQQPDAPAPNSPAQPMPLGHGGHKAP